jgi:hypothetical protein
MLLQQGYAGPWRLLAHRAQELRHRRAKAIPARQRQPALAPAEAPGNGAQVFNALRGLARGRARTDIELGDFADAAWRVEEIFGEALGVS